MKDADRLRRAIDQLVYLPSLREGSSAGPSPALAAVDAAAAAARERRKKGGAAGSGLATGAPPPPPPPRPWDREGLFRRAATFKPSTWFDKDAETAGPLRAAARGWTNVGVDLLRCEFCGEKLVATAATTATGGDERESEDEKTSFASRLVSCHAAECPWRTGPACDLESLAQFPPLTREAAEAGFKAREAAALALDVLPPLSRGSYDVPARAAPGRLEALLQLGPRPEGDENEEEEVGEAPEPPVLLLAEEGNGNSSKPSPPDNVVARHGGELHRRMARLVALFGWTAEIVAPGLAKRALEELAAAEQRRMKAAVEEATARGKGRRERGGSGGGVGGGGDDAASETGTGDGELPLLWPPKPLPARPPASAMPAGTVVRACDAALRCEACGATAGLWSFVPSELCGSGSGGRSDEEGGGAGADNGNDSTPPAAKRAKKTDPSPLSDWSPSPPGKAAATAAAAAPSRPRELDLVSLHRSWCPFVDPLDCRRRRRVGWRWTLAALVPAVPGDDEAGEGDARLLRLEDEEDEVEKEAGAKRDAVGAAADTPASSPPTSSERATDRLRAVLARAGIVAPAVNSPSRSLVN